MSIEFLCAHCGQKLRVSDEAAGRRAKCPSCGQLNQIPQTGAPAEDPFAPSPSLPPFQSGDSPFQTTPINPYLSPQTGFGGTSIPPIGGKIGNVAADIGSILNYAFEVWQKNLGLLLGATLVMLAISLGFALVAEAAQRVARTSWVLLCGS